jgi:predicted dehydrogenase
MSANAPSSSRRTFLKGAVAAVASPGIVPSFAAGSGSSPADRITVGMIGMGRQALYANLPPFLHSPDTQVVAVCDVDSWRLDKARAAVEAHYAAASRSGAYKGCSTHGDFREILSRADIDAVMISTPDHWHVPIAVAAARAGKDISCEKPLTASIAEGRLLADTVTRHARVFRTDSEFRSIGIFQRACELVLNGRIGKLHTIRTAVPAEAQPSPPQPPAPVPEELDYEMWLGPAAFAPYVEKRVHPRRDYGRPGWMCVRDYCFGMITNWGAHINDIAQWGNGTDRSGPVEIEGTGLYPADALWDVLQSFEVHYRFANGVQLIYKMDRPYVRFEGADGWIEADYASHSLKAHPPSILHATPGPDEIHLPLKSEKADFIDAVKSRSPTLADAEVGHRTNSLCILGHIAIQLGRKLRWDPVAERFLDDDLANRFLARPMRAPWQI